MTQTYPSVWEKEAHCDAYIIYILLSMLLVLILFMSIEKYTRISLMKNKIQDSIHSIIILFGTINDYKEAKIILTNEMKYDTRNDFSKKIFFSSYQAAGKQNLY